MTTLKTSATLLLAGATALALTACSSSDAEADSVAVNSTTETTTVPPPSEWNTLEDMAEAIHAVTDACPTILDNSEEEGYAGCGVGGQGSFLFAVDTAENSGAAANLKIASVFQDNEEDEVVLWDEGWAILCFSDNLKENCEALHEEFPTAKWVDVEAKESAPSTSTGSASTPAAQTPAGTFGDGTHLVGNDIQPGTYRNDGTSESCYWERQSGLTGTSADIIANDLPTGQAYVTIDPSDKAFTSKRCGTWELVE